MRLFAIAATLLLLATPVTAQTTGYTVAVFSGAATSPDSAAPIQPAVTYPISQVLCNQTKIPETLPIVNPQEGRFDDPANPTTRDCAMTIEPQFRALPVGSGYKAAVRVVAGAQVSAWSAFSSPFAVTAVQSHPCDGATITTATVLEGTRTLTFCNDGRDVNGNLVAITGWAIYVDGVRSVLANVTVGSTTNAAGLRNYSVTVPLTRGTHVIQIVALNAQGEAARSTNLTVTVTAPLGVPTVSTIKSIQ